MKSLFLFIVTFFAAGGFSAAQAACSYKRICTIGGDCTYQLVCDGNVPNPGDHCEYVNVCDAKGCHYVWLCR